MKVTIRDQAFSVGAVTIFNWIAKLREFLREARRMPKKDTPAVLANKYSFVWIWASKLVENTFQRRFKRLNKLKVLRCHVSCFAIKWIWKQMGGGGKFQPSDWIQIFFIYWPWTYSISIFLLQSMTRKRQPIRIHKPGTRQLSWSLGTQKKLYVFTNVTGRSGPIRHLFFSFLNSMSMRFIYNFTHYSCSNRLVEAIEI